MASRFKDLDVSVEDFISEQENESTKKKTLQNVAVLQQFLASAVGGLCAQLRNKNKWRSDFFAFLSFFFSSIEDLL